MHSIGWLVVDDQGNIDGIGSRFFNVMNASGPLAAAEPEPSAPAPAA